MNAAPAKRHSERELRAMAYALCDEIETRALALMAREPGLDIATATNRVVLAIGAGK